MDTLTDYNNARLDYNTDTEDSNYIFWNRPYEGTNEELYVGPEHTNWRIYEMWADEERMIREGEEALEYNNSFKDSMNTRR